jgi:hypothetical protein
MRIGTASLSSALLMGLCGCSDFITPPESDPNALPDVTVDQLFVAAQNNISYWQSGGFRGAIHPIWMQQMGGVTRQLANHEQYDVNETDTSGLWDNAYQGGGMIDLQKAIDKAEESGWIGYAGILKLHVAFLAGMVASIFGDMPFREALQPGEFPEPALDDQADVYADVQGLLSEAIADMMDGSGVGPSDRDLSFGGDLTRWIAVAHTLKARFHLHWVEVEGTGRYSQALAEAEQGIRSTSGNWTEYHTSTPGEENLWFFRGEAGDVRANDLIMSMMNNETPEILEDDEPRASVYWELATGDFAGQRIGHVTGATTGDPLENASLLNAPAEQDYRLPILSCSENYFIIAESHAALGNDAAARTALKDALGCQESWWGVDLSELKDPVDGLSGAALFEEIMKQKFIGLLLQIEIWNDYKRTCLPARVPAPGHSAIPGRWFYSINERQTNSNVPPPEQQPDRNDNDPQPCTP